MGAGNQQGDPQDGAEDAAQPAPIRAHTYLGHFSSFSRPVILSCDNGKVYVVKARQPNRPEVSRAMISERVIGGLANAFGAPVPEVGLIDVPNELCAQPEMNHMMAGVAHGSQYIQNATERANIAHYDLPENRRRFSLLALLYGWAQAGDHQFIYDKDVPHYVHSVDHGHFFPGGPNWSSATLDAAIQPAEADAQLIGACTLTPAELCEAAERLGDVGTAAVAVTVSNVPAEWGLTPDERVAMIAFLTRRRLELIARYGPPANPAQEQQP